MLTKDDLSLIAKLLDSKLETKLDSKLKPIKKDIVRIRRDQKTITSYFDNEYLNLRERIERIETHLGLSSLQ